MHISRQKAQAKLKELVRQFHVILCTPFGSQKISANSKRYRKLIACYASHEYKGISSNKIQEIQTTSRKLNFVPGCCMPPQILDHR